MELREADGSYQDGPIVNHLSENNAGNVKKVEVTIAMPDKDKEAEKPKTDSTGKEGLTMIIACVIACVFITTQGWRASLIALLICILVFIGVIVYGKIKSNKHAE